MQNAMYAAGIAIDHSSDVDHGSEALHAGVNYHRLFWWTVRI